jgi:hypothetical protein
LMLKRVGGSWKTILKSSWTYSYSPLKLVSVQIGGEKLLFAKCNMLLIITKD